MLHTTHQTAKPANATSLFDQLGEGCSALFASIRQRRQAARDLATLGALSDAQLADAGIDRGSIEAARPSVEVKAGLMANLMSMR
jgi:uncharacterized protein YjiS (DUF1127 family)